MKRAKKARNPRKSATKNKLCIFEDLVSAEVYNHIHLFVEIIRNLFFDGCDVVFLLYHRLMIDKADIAKEKQKTHNAAASLIE